MRLYNCFKPHNNELLEIEIENTKCLILVPENQTHLNWNWNLWG